MKRFAVAYMTFMDNDLRIELHTADNWKEAILKYSSFSKEEYREQMQEWLSEMPDDKEEMKEYFFNADSLLDVIEILGPF